MDIDTYEVIHLFEYHLIAIVPMNFPLWYRDFTNLSSVLDWHLGLIISLLKLLKFIVN